MIEHQSDTLPVVGSPIAVSIPWEGGGGVFRYFSYIRRFGTLFWVQKNEFFFGGGGGGEEIVDIFFFWGGGGHYEIGLF